MAHTDRDLLVALYKATGGARWRQKTKWNTGADLSRWHGVKVNEQGRVIELHLALNNLEGPIPGVLGALNKLQALSLSQNHLTGNIPKELGALSMLQTLSLDTNQLTGEIPASLGQLGNLYWLYLHANKLIGSIPKELGSLSKLTTLWLNDNELTGEIPKEVGALSKLQLLSLYANRLTGSIPKELGNLTELEELALFNNQLTAFWDHSSDIGGGKNSQQHVAGEPIPNQLGRLLDVLSKVEKRNKLLIDKNPWEEPPEAVLEKGIPAVRGYFADLFAGGCVSRIMLKVILVGQEGAGKTSLRQSIRNRRPTRTSGSDESTVQIDVEEMDMEEEGVTLRIYDCAGQVAYTGLLQMFLSPRAVTLLVCDTAAFGERRLHPREKHQLQQDLVKLKELRVCDWLRSLSFRIPDSDVVLVATKCDLAAGTATDMAARMERATRTWLESWSGSQMPVVRVEDGVSLTSCAAVSAPEEQGHVTLDKREATGMSPWVCDWRKGMPGKSLPSLLDRIMYNGKGSLRGAAMVFPRSWDMAIEVLDALGRGRDPVQAVHRVLHRRDGSAGLPETPAIAKDQRGTEGLTMAELSAKWIDVVKALEKGGVRIANPGHALEGALSIREYQGSLVRHDTYVFLDVVWLTKILKPLLNHRDDEDPLCGNISLGDTGITLDDDEQIASWNRFKEIGILEPVLARVLWPDGLSDYVLPTLISLGLAHTLVDEPTEGLLVLLRLGEDCPADVGKELDDFRSDHTAVLSVVWKIFMGTPPGAIEKVLTRCCGIGELRTFWRFGVLVQGSFGGLAVGKTFALLIEYSHESSQLDMKVYGNIGTAAPWAALSLGISAVLTMCSEFPGLRWRASLKCPKHEQDIQISATTRCGDNLLCEKGCSLCNPKTGGVGAAAKDLLKRIDICQTRGEIFKEVDERFAKLQREYPILDAENSRQLDPEQKQRRFDSWLRGIKEEMESVVHGARGPTDEVESLKQSVLDLQQQLEQHQDTRRWIEAEFKPLVATIYADDGVTGKLDFLVTMLMAERSEKFDTPRRACVLPPWKFAQTHGLSEDEQMPEAWVKLLEEWRAGDFKGGKGFFTKKKRLFLVCAHTHRLVPCGPHGQGYDIQQPRTWFRTSLSVTTFVLQVVCTTLSAMAAPPLAGVSAAIQATVCAAKENWESMLLDQPKEQILHGGPDVDGTPQQAELDEDAWYASMLKGAAYASLREFVQGEEKTASLEIFSASKKAHRERRAPPSASNFVCFVHKMVQVHGRDAGVQWVLKEYEQAWYAAVRPPPIA